MKQLIACAFAALLAGTALAGDVPLMAEGEIRKVDKEAAKLTIKHGPLTELNMGAMVMVFRVKDKAMLEQVAVGDKVRFAAARVDGALTVTALDTAR
jgi:Cu(I)/Ag(I) efflux system protein CusF